MIFCSNSCAPARSNSWGGGCIVLLGSCICSRIPQGFGCFFGFDIRDPSSQRARAPPPRAAKKTMTSLNRSSWRHNMFSLSVMRLLLLSTILICSSAALYSLPSQNAASYTAAGSNASLLLAFCNATCIVQLDGSLLPPPSLVPGSSVVGVDVTTALNAAISNASALYKQHGAPCVVVLPSETAAEPYFITSTIGMSSGVIVAGALNSSSPQSTVLVPGAAKFTAFSFSGGPSVAASATAVNDVTGSSVNVSAQLSSAASALLSAGKRAFLSAFEANDHQLLVDLEPIYSKESEGWDPSWAANSRGHLMEILAVDSVGSSLQLRSAIPMVLQNATLQVLDGSSFLTDAGIAYLTLQRLALPAGWVQQVQKQEEGSDGMQSIVDFIVTNYAAELLFHSLDISGMTRSGVWISTSAHVTVSACYMHDPQLWFDTGSGQGYGVVVGQWATACLVEDNSFTKMRHSMMIKQGANSNVLGYNWSDDVYGENCLKGVCVPFPTVDLDSHGHWGHHNLFEGNIVHRIAAADWWGPCPNNVFFKNMATVDGIALKYASDQTLVLDNAIAKYSAENNCQQNLTCIGNFVCQARPCDTTHQPSTPFPSSHAEAQCAAQNKHASADPRPRSFYSSVARDSCNSCFNAPSLNRRMTGALCPLPLSSQ